MNFGALQHSVFLQALGSAILNSLWQCFILWLIYESIVVSYKSATARLKNNLSTLLLFSCFAWFLISFLSRFFNLQTATSVSLNSETFPLPAHPEVYAASPLRAVFSYASASLPYLSVAYIFLLFFLTSRLFAAYRYVYLISSKRLVKPEKELGLFALKAARQIGIVKTISVWISNHIDVPATIGFMKPVILIPLASINNLSCQQLEAVILHELAHIKRNDYIINLVISVIETILFFNPFVVLLSNIMKRERENCCDDFVLQYRYDPHSYASALLRLEESRTGKLKLAVGAVSGKKQLLSRIKRITNSPGVSRHFNYGQKMAALLLVTGVICSVAWLSPDQKKQLPAGIMTHIANPATKSKTNTENRMMPRVNAIVAGKQDENARAKHFSGKSDVLLPEAGVDNTPVDNSSDGQTENEENQDVQVPDNTAPETINANQPLFYPDEANLKLPAFINLSNFPFQNMNFKIDLSSIDLKNLNENLKEAYKQINALDWSKVQTEINKNFPNFYFGTLSKKDMGVPDDGRLKRLFKIDLVRTQRQQNTSKILKDELKKVMLRQNSFHTSALALINENEERMQEAYKNAQQQYQLRGSEQPNNYYLNYSANTAEADNAAEPGNEEEAKSPCVEQRNKAALNLSAKGVKIYIGRVRNHVQKNSPVEKPFQFSFSKGDEKPNSGNVVTVEVNDLP